jgi:hypothetical protein
MSSMSSFVSGAEVAHNACQISLLVIGNAPAAFRNVSGILRFSLSRKNGIEDGFYERH